MSDQYEYRMNSQYPTMKMAVPFTPNVVFIYNPSNAWLYLNTSTYKIPTTTLYDISIPPESYLIFIPYTPNTEYGGLLVAPGIDPIAWDCWIEFRRGEKELDWNITPGFPFLQPLNPLPDLEVVASFTFEIIDPYPEPIFTAYGDTLIDSACIQPRAVETGCGNTGDTQIINSGGEWGNASARSESLINRRCWGLAVNIQPCDGEIWTGVTEVRARFQWTVFGGGWDGLAYYAYVNGVLVYDRGITPSQGYSDGNWYEIIIPLNTLANPVTDIRIGFWNDSGAFNYPQTFTIDRIYVFGTAE